VPKSIAPARVLPDDALGVLSLTLGPSGVVLGRDSASAPVLVRLFGPEPISVAFVGGWWAAQILIYRCLAHGATVVVDAVDTATPGQNGTLAAQAQWLALDRVASGAGDRVRPAAGDPALSQPASGSQPLLHLHDLGHTAGSRPSPQPWQTNLTVLSAVTPASQHIIASADVVLAQRLDPRDAALLGSALLLGPEFTARIAALGNDMVAAFRGQAVRYIWLTPTELERQLFG
jgi:hypothetical protein